MLLWFNSSVYAQQKEVTLHIKGAISLDSLTNLVHSKTGVRFSFNSVKVSGNKIIKFMDNQYTINKLLQYVHVTTGLYYFPYKKYYIFQDNPPKQKAIKSNAVLRQEHKAPITTSKKKFVNVQAKTETSSLAKSKTIEPILKKDTVAIKSKPINVDTSKKIVASMDTSKKRIVSTVKPTAIAEKPKTTNGLLHLQAGVFSTEILYANAGVEIGIKPIHALFSYATNFEASGPRIGLGSIIKNNENSQIQVKATICFLQRSFVADSFGTIVTPFTIKGQLYNASGEWCRKLDKHFLFKAGISLNALHSTYYRDKEKMPFGTFTIAPGNPDKSIHLLHFPYLITNSYNNLKSDNWKTWIGLFVGLYYNFRQN